jgi:hypothetical protein
VAESLAGVAAVIAGDSPEQAARLAGAAGALFQASAAVPTLRQQADLDAVSQQATRAADRETVAAALAAGAALAQDAAVTAALEHAGQGTGAADPPDG